MKTVSVKSRFKDYSVYIGNGIISRIGNTASETVSGRNALIITDITVAGLWLNPVADSLSEAGFNAVKYVIKDGEGSKTSAVLFDLLEYCAESQLCRNDIIIALGGGVVTDISGLCASLYMRGIQYISVPTTVLCAVDASVGGKTAVNLSSGKNLCGAVYPPSTVICDTNTFDTLPEKIYNDGFAEIIKYAFIADSGLLSLINCENRDINEIIFRCISIKAGYVQEDELDNGNRRILNFGHTVAHAIEKLSDYSISHGEAVAIGMCIITAACEKRGICSKGTASILKKTLTDFSLPCNTSFSAEQIAKAVVNDKKRNGNAISVCAIKEVGSCLITPIVIDEFTDFILQGITELEDE